MNDLQKKQIREKVKRMQDVARLRHLSLSTEKSYIGWVKRYAAWLVDARPEGEPRKKVERFLTKLAHGDISASSQNQAFNALLFFYRDCERKELGEVNALRAKRTERKRYSPNLDETKTLLAGIRDQGSYPVRLVVRLIYGCGLRLNESLAIRLKDIDHLNSIITIRNGKGGKDRVVNLPCSLSNSVKAQMEVAAAVAERDRLASLPIQLPNRLEKKYPRLEFSKEWAFLFPLNSPCRHPRTGRLVRWHMLDQTVQRALRETTRRLNLNPMITAHSLRHAFATHSMASGVNVRDIQAVMGHNSLETTMGYLHPEADRVPSPIDSMVLAV
ncbi:MAG: tyrosine-type recombinase/integrase [Bacteroidales bacterium]|nr:tyrosine-type recombinase/integrase [Bacteroidales bacterium]